MDPTLWNVGQVCFSRPNKNLSQQMMGGEEVDTLISGVWNATLFKAVMA